MRVEDADGVRTITFDRPERKNALTTDDASELAARLDEVTASAFVNVGLIPETGGTVTLPRLVGLRTAKEAIHANLGASWREGLDREATLQALARGTEAHEEGVAAFLEGRPPAFD
jgi:enoyl-CoA hydratase/carnithine racemase